MPKIIYLNFIGKDSRYQFQISILKNQRFNIIINRDVPIKVFSSLLSLGWFILYIHYRSNEVYKTLNIILFADDRIVFRCDKNLKQCLVQYSQKVIKTSKSWFDFNKLVIFDDHVTQLQNKLVIHDFKMER